MRKLRWLKVMLISFITIILLIFAIDLWVTRSTQKQIFSDVNTIPAQKVGLLLGTSKYVAGGYINLYYKYRIDATVALFKAGKIEYVLVSGDNSNQGYNEPEMMMKDLVAQGIPAEKIFLDYAGFRTLDSILRCKEVFGENNITIISQPFHNQRALFIANNKSIQAIAYNAQDVSKAYGIKVGIREKFARVKMLLDLCFNKQPKFYGQKISIDNVQNSAAYSK